MPPLNSVKTYIEGGYYHIYNRGVDKRKIFQRDLDYSVFLRLLKEYLLPIDHPDLLKIQGIIPRRKPLNCYDDIELISYCLMPNHFHLLIRQKSKYGLKRFSKALLTNYSMYFNKTYERTGRLFQGVYKAVLILDESYFLHLSRYIHLNPSELLARDNPLHKYKYSSYKYYIGINCPDWLNPKPILQMFQNDKSQFPSKILTYQSFVENYKENERELLGRFTLED
ncbi:MAG: hypothetical protein US62_C0015G0010 [Candidatus Woesebacteria bacterium GW2011_GWA1_37_8]|uniref:Transposase IS200-like domain-containing protein n=2 Tax=Candidatus Woeseibacteriota TaxID=1752722 RepID=A0A0G0L9H7_9BACT|nr:MAG: hypothetical protein US62_C0015G0010 [Candidatus Woesebacteria bacterium GW2011_GWA1_37_8]KKQ87632.1 MAG: hypothetical protein UT10_C0003G0036 [Candidatus Woesebacteria bacterium GW2011_GWB1_38_8b]